MKIAMKNKLVLKLKESPLLSVIIPTLNEEKDLPRLLNSIKKQDFSDYEIIVADSNSKDKTQEIARKFGCRIIDGGRPAVGRNKGARIAKGRLLLFLDSDVVLPENFLRKSVSEFQKRNLSVATCFSKPLSGNPIYHLYYFFSDILFWMSPVFSPQAYGHCIFARKEFHDNVNGFDESLFIGEDHDYARRISKHGKCGLLYSRIYVSVRRFEREGFLTVLFKYLYFDLLRIFKKDMKKDYFSYEFGKYK